jgi:hypothetical protein
VSEHHRVPRVAQVLPGRRRVWIAARVDVHHTADASVPPAGVPRRRRHVSPLSAEVVEHSGQQPVVGVGDQPPTWFEYTTDLVEQTRGLFELVRGVLDTELSLTTRTTPGVVEVAQRDRVRLQ